MAARCLLGCLVRATSCFFAVMCLIGLSADLARCIETGFKQYTDPNRRFVFDYPAGMEVAASNPDEVKVFHSSATLRINVFIEARPPRAIPRAEVLLEAFKKGLQDEMRDVSILEEGKHSGLGESQGYVICSFKDKRGIFLVQLVQYYVTKNRLLQLIISDRPEGFKNLAEVIRKVHGSFRIIDPSLR